jgi:serine/threonine protein kinase
LDNDGLTAHIHRLLKRLKPTTSTSEITANLCKFTLEDLEGDASTTALSIVSTKDWARLTAFGKTQGWLIDPTQVSLGPIAGEGAFGETHRGMWRGAEAAVKIVKPGEGASSEAFARELATLALVRHRNVVNLYGAVIQPENDKCWLICEWLPGGTLTEWLHGKNGGRRPSRTPLQRLRMALDVACGLEALEQHEPPILHRDLKPSNIMIDASGRAKVADMGLSRVLTPEALMELTPETGSYRYMAPEVVRHDLYATQADVWSWGCIVSELLTGVVPYSERHLTPIQVALAVADGGLRPIIPAECPPGLAELLVSILDADPMERPSAAVAAEVMRRVVEEEERKEAAERGVAAGVTAAWNRWMMKPSQ